MQNNVDDFIEVADVLCRLRHDLVNDLAKELNVALCIPIDSIDEFTCGSLVLEDT